MSDASLPFNIRYQPALPVVMLVCSAFILATSLLVGVSVNTLTGLLLLFIGVGFLTQPAIVVTGRAFEHRNVLGMTLKRHEFESLADVLFEEGRVYVVQGGKREQVIGMRFHLRSSDLEQLAEMARETRRRRDARE